MIFEILENHVCGTAASWIWPRLGLPFDGEKVAQPYRKHAGLTLAVAEPEERGGVFDQGVEQLLKHTRD